jgi:hypothetical protein
VTSCACSRQGEPCAYPPARGSDLCDHCQAGCSLATAGDASAHLDATATLDCSERIQAMIDGLPPATIMVRP